MRSGTLNCGHSASPIILGVNDPQYTPQELEQMRQENAAGVTFDGKHYTLYEATQRQRKIERRIRDQKRKILIDEKLGDQSKLETDQSRLVRLRQEYSRFSKGVGLRTQHERAEVAGFTWKHGKAAEKAAGNQAAASQKPKSAAKPEVKSSPISEKPIDKSENSGTIKVMLTDIDKMSIQDYMSAKSYAVNEKLRTGVELTDDERTFVENLDAALKKMPTYQGNLQRSLFFDSGEDVSAFLQTHTMGSKVIYNQYISTTQGAVYNPDGQIQILIKNSKRGRDISSLNSNESEVIYERGASFTVVQVVQKDGKYYIFMEESDE